MVSDDEHERFLAALLAADRGACDALVDGLVAQQVPVRALYDLFTKALHAVGEAWAAGTVSVATEHLATAIVETLVARVFPVVLARRPHGKRAIVSCAADEFHQLGGRIVADVLELRGWSVSFIGANTPVEVLVERVQRERPDLVALSLSIASHMDNILLAIASIRAEGVATRIVVGGQGLSDDCAPRLAGHADVVACRSLAELEALAPTWETA